MDWKFILGIMLPAAGAGFIWLTGIARKDPPLFMEIEAVLKRWIPGALSAVMLMAGFTFWRYHDVEGSGIGDVLVITGLIVVALLQLRSALPFFGRVARLPAAGTQTPASEAELPPERVSASDR